MVTAIYPGSFDPVTMGHLDIVARGAALFEKVIVAVYGTPSKDLLFSTEERVQLFQDQAGGDAASAAHVQHAGIGG